MPLPQPGHRSRNPQPCSQHEMRVADRQRRRKYGASSPARQSGQNCSQVAALRRATWRSGNSSRVPGPAPSVIIAIRSRATRVCRWRTSRVLSGSARSSRADHIPAPSPRVSPKSRGATPCASASRCSQLDSNSSARGATVTGQRLRLEFAVARLRLDGETRAGHAVANRHDRYSRFCRAGAWRRADSGR